MTLHFQTLNDQAYTLLKEKILSNEIGPGTRLVDSQLAEDFGVSRTPARDAIRKLAEEGLVITEPGKKGYFVYKPTVQDINEVYEMRQIIDLAAVEKLILEILPRNPGAIEHLKDCCRTSDCDIALFLKCDEEFHQAMVELCQNSRMTETYRQLGAYMHAFRSKTSQDLRRKEKAAVHHQQILEGLQALDLDRTKKLIRDHILLGKDDTMKDYILDI